MKTISKVLGISGGILLLFFMAIIFFMILSLDSTDSVSKQNATSAALTFYVWGSSITASAVIGIIGGVIVKRRKVLGGIFMLIAAVSSFAFLYARFGSIMGISIVVGLFFLLGAGYAFID